MFEVECKYDHEDLYLSITHNGYQWTSIAIKNSEHEIPLIIEALQRHLTSRSSRAADSKESVFVCPKCGLEHYSYMAASKCCR